MIRLVQRKLIIPRGDTGTFSVPVLPHTDLQNVAVFTIFDTKTRTKILTKQIRNITADHITIQFEHEDTVNLPVGRYVWDIKFYQNPTYMDDELVDGDEVDSYYSAFSLPECDITPTGDNLLVSDDAPTATVDPMYLNIIDVAVTEAQTSAEQAAQSASIAEEKATESQTYAEAAETASQNASDSADIATEQADIATAQATIATTAASNAQSAAQAAQTAQSQTEAQVAIATNQAEIATNAAETATAAQTATETAAAQAANSATTAGTSAQNATESATLASQHAASAAVSAGNAAISAQTANTAAGNAQTSANSAQRAANEIKNLTASATTLAPGSGATAAYDYATGRLNLGIPRGDTGNGIASAVMNADYTLTIRYTNGTTFTTPPLKGEQGDAFHIVKTYASIAAMNADYNNPEVQIGEFVMIVGAIDDPDNAKVYVKGDTQYNFVVDMSGSTGIQGVGIDSITKTSTQGTVDTYTILYTDGTFTTFTVTNGEDGSEYTVLVQNDQPVERTNKLWIPPDAGVPQAIPTVEEVTAALNNKADKTDTELLTTLSRGRVNNSVVGEGSIAFGQDATASEKMSIALGTGTVANGPHSIALGVYNELFTPRSDIMPWHENTYCIPNETLVTKDSKTYRYIGTTPGLQSSWIESNWQLAPYTTKEALIIGKGSKNKRENIFSIDWNGQITIRGSVTAGLNASSDNTSSAFGVDCTSVDNSFAAGYEAQANGFQSISLGHSSVATGSSSIALGNKTLANAAIMHAIGRANVSATLYPSRGDGPIDHGDYYHVGEKYQEDNVGLVCLAEDHAIFDQRFQSWRPEHPYNANYWSYIINTADDLFVVGNDNSLNGSTRSNALKVTWEGNAYFMGDIYTNCTASSTGGTKVATVNDITVQDVQINNTSILTNGIANIPMGTNSNMGLLQAAGAFGGIYANNSVLYIANATESEIKAGSNIYKPITPQRQEISTFYGLAKAAGDITQSASNNAVGTYTAEAKIAIKAMLGVNVDDVQIDGTSVVSNGIANVPKATSTDYGVMRIGVGLQYSPVVDKVTIAPASVAQCKAGTETYNAIVPSRQHASVFYGLAKAAGDDTQSSSDNAVGTYTDAAKAAIHTMLGIDPAAIASLVEIPLVETVTGTTPTIVGQPNTRYNCGEVTTLNITPPVSGSIDVIFESGTTPTVLTVPNTVKWPSWFDATTLEADTTYEILITDGIYGSVMTWAT